MGRQGVVARGGAAAPGAALQSFVPDPFALEARQYQRLAALQTAKNAPRSSAQGAR